MGIIHVTTFAPAKAGTPIHIENYGEIRILTGKVTEPVLTACWRRLVLVTSAIRRPGTYVKEPADRAPCLGQGEIIFLKKQRANERRKGSQNTKEKKTRWEG